MQTGANIGGSNVLAGPPYVMLVVRGVGAEFYNFVFWKWCDAQSTERDIINNNNMQIFIYLAIMI